MKNWKRYSGISPQSSNWRGLFQYPCIRTFIVGERLRFINSRFENLIKQIMLIKEIAFSEKKRLSNWESGGLRDLINIFYVNIFYAIKGSSLSFYFYCFNQIPDIISVLDWNARAALRLFRCLDLKIYNSWIDCKNVYFRFKILSEFLRWRYHYYHYSLMHSNFYFYFTTYVFFYTCFNWWFFTEVWLPSRLGLSNTSTAPLQQHPQWVSWIWY